MEKKLIVSLHDGIAALSPENTLTCYAPLEGVGALCAGEDGVFCADGGGAIWRFDRETLMPRSLGCGGPGICDLTLSACGTRLYALLAEADCVLMSDAHTGSAMAVNRCGCNPRGMACGREVLAVAGGESASVHLFHVHTLEHLGDIPMPGPVYSVAVCGETVCALCLGARRNTVLAVWRDTFADVLRLPGMPGCLLAEGEELYIAVCGALYAYSLVSGVLRLVCGMPGRASRIQIAMGQMFIWDPLSECVFSSFRGGAWRRICCGARDICAPLPC